MGLAWEQRTRLLGRRGWARMRVVEAVPSRHTAVEARIGRDRVRTSYAVTSHHHRVRVSLTMVADLSQRSLPGRLAWALWGGLPLHSTRRRLVGDLVDLEAEVSRRAWLAEVIPISRGA